MNETQRLLRWYPPGWRARYGDEFIALLDDEVAAGRMTRRARSGVVRAGLLERGHEFGLVGSDLGANSLRAGALVVLAMWTIFVIAGISFSKLAEHFGGSVPLKARSLAQHAFDGVAVGAVVGGVLVIAGAILAAPSLLQQLRSGGWRLVQRRCGLALALSVAVIVSLVPLVYWAHQLNAVQRNGGDNVYGLVVTAWALLIALTLASWTSLVMAAVRQVEWSRWLMRVGGSLAIALAGAMTLVVASVVWWWWVMTVHAPWFLSSGAVGSRPYSVNLQLMVTLGLMAFAAAGAAAGASRVVRSWSAVD